MDAEDKEEEDMSRVASVEERQCDTGACKWEMRCAVAVCGVPISVRCTYRVGTRSVACSAIQRHVWR